MTKAVTLLLKQFKDQFGDYPKLTQFDDCKNFFNLGVKTVLETHGIRYVEKILMRKKLKGKNVVLVKMLGYDAKHNSWIPGSHIQDSVVYTWQKDSTTSKLGNVMRCVKTIPMNSCRANITV